MRLPDTQPLHLFAGRRPPGGRAWPVVVLALAALGCSSGGSEGGAGSADADGPGLTVVRLDAGPAGPGGLDAQDGLSEGTSGAEPAAPPDFEPPWSPDLAVCASLPQSQRGPVLPANPACEWEPGPAPGPLAVAVEWEVTEGGFVVGPIAVGHLADDDGDGQVGSGDVPDLVMAVGLVLDDPGVAEPGRVRAYSGDGAGLHWEWPVTATANTEVFPAARVMPAIGDLDGDGQPEVVLVGGGMLETLIVLDGQGQWLWSAPLAADLGGLAVDHAMRMPQLVDFEGDGCVEIVVGGQVLNCGGELLFDVRAVLAPSDGYPGVSSIGYFDWPWSAADVNADGSMELAGSWGLLGSSDDTWWTVADPDWAGEPVLLDLDGDADAELVVLATNSVVQARGGSYFNHKCRAYDTDGTVLWERTAPCSDTSALVEDVDGDGSAELVTATWAPSKLWVINHDGTELWSVESSDTSCCAVPSAFDFEGDGRVEILYADEDSLRILDGPTGALRWQMTDHKSLTYREYPVVADVDGDGEAEIVLTRGAWPASSWHTDRQGFTVFGRAPGTEPAWRPARPVWNQYEYRQTNVEDDASIPTHELPHFTANNSIRSAVQPPLKPGSAYRPTMGLDAAIELVAACATSCTGGLVQIVAQVYNRGHGMLPAGIPVTVKRADGTVIQSQPTEGVIAPGFHGAPLSFTFKRSDAGEGDLSVDVDGSSGIVDECDEENNSLTLPSPQCAESP